MSGHGPYLLVFDCLEDSALEQVDIVDEVMVLILPPAAIRVGDKISFTKTEQFLNLFCVFVCSFGIRKK